MAGRTRNPDPPDASYQENDPTEFVLRPDPDVIAARHQEAASAAALRANLDERDRIDAKEYGLGLNTWRLMGDAARRAAIEEHNRRTPGDAGMVEHTIKHGRLDSMADLGNPYERAVRQLEEDPAEARQFTILCRPVVNHPRWGRIHQPPGVVKVPRRQMAKKLGQGFTYYPEADFIPDPTVVCDLCLEANVDPPFRGYPDKGAPDRSLDVERHQKARHPEEFFARERQQTRTGQDDLHTTVGRLVEVVELLAKGQKAS